MRQKLFIALLLGATALPLLQGGFPAVATGVGAGVSVAVDGRTLGTQTEDESIECKAS